MFSEESFVIILFYLLISADFLVCQSTFQVPDTRAKHCIPVMFFLYTKASYLSNPVYNFSLTLRDCSWFSVWTTQLQGHGKFITWHNYESLFSKRQSTKWGKPVIFILTCGKSMYKTLWRSWMRALKLL